LRLAVDPVEPWRGCRLASPPAFPLNRISDMLIGLWTERIGAVPARNFEEPLAMPVHLLQVSRAQSLSRKG